MIDLIESFQFISINLNLDNDSEFDRQLSQFTN